MDIKLKNIKYAAGTKAVAVILIWLCFLSAVGSGVFLLENREIAYSDSYYDTYKFKNEFGRLVHNVVEANIKLKNVESIKASGRTEKFIAEDIERFYSIENRLSGMVNFMFYIKNSPTGEIITNIIDAAPEALIKKQPGNIYFSQWKSKYDLPMYRNEIEKMLFGTNYEVYAAVLQPLKQGDIFYDVFVNYSRIKEMSLKVYMLMVSSLVLLVIAAAYLAIVAGRREKGGEIVFTNVDSIYTDVHTLLVLIAAFLSVMIVVNVSGSWDIAAWVFPFIVLSVDVFIGISYVLSMIRQIKARTIFKNTLIAVLYKKLKVLARLCFEGKLFRASTLLFLLAYGLINGIFFALGTNVRSNYQIPVIFSLFLAFNAAVVYFSAKALLSLSQIIKAAKEISSGNLDYALNSSEISVAFSSLAEDIKNIQGGMKKAVAQAIKGERMKTELITNVSHDLKTPLTSIVNYVGLLKNEDLNNQRAEEYVSILEEKSGRLKQLIEDLVEASKASSGSLQVNAEKVDLHELVMQACGEYEEKIKEAELDIRINAEEKNTYIYADGKQMWRIIENLFSNAIKYSMPQSRVYINLAAGSEHGSLTIKNISAFPLDIPPEQLTERFVRGDVSRTTEGSGLGLSIAQSLTALQGGSFKIEIDGDLFKVNVEIPLWMEKP
ncbi:MAG: histidine kinase [Clostridia bacterium BRH_c25]|nr:MAG: histidine kinase [Clostridia bacterium BRH_c25]